MDETGAVEQDVEWAGGRDDGVHRVILQYVENPGFNSPFAIEALQGFGIDICRDNAGASLGEGKGAGAADALACGRDQNAFVLQG